MSVSEFDNTLRNYIIKKYDEQISLGGLGVGSTKSLSKSITDSNIFRNAFTSGASGHDSIITKKGLEDLAQKLAESSSKGAIKKMATELFNSLDFDNFMSWLELEVSGSAKRTFTGTASKVEEITGGVKISNITQKNAKLKFEQYLFNILDSTYTKQPRTVKRLKKHINDNIESGHLAGIFSLKFKLALGLEVNFDDKAKNYRDFTVSMGDENQEFADKMDVILKALLDADFLTSNIVDKQDLMLKAVKNTLGKNPRLQTELQFGPDNGESGGLLINAGKSIKALILNISGAGSSTTASSGKGYLQTLVTDLTKLQKVIEFRANELLKVDSDSKELAEGILKNADTLRKLIETKGSPSIVEGIGITMKNILEKNSILKAVATSTTIKRTTVKKDIVSANLNKVIKNTVKEIQKAKAKLTKGNETLKIKQPAIRTMQGQFYSLASLQNLINTQLQSVISANMGSGSETKILNYRTGRFAESAKVESLSQSREGMITAFYSYMKNPYATFSEGGRQSSPKTRDPKLLISQSIREIAASKVANRMRAVNI